MIHNIITIYIDNIITYCIPGETNRRENDMTGKSEPKMSGDFSMFGMKGGILIGILTDGLNRIVGLMLGYPLGMYNVY